ncbi:MAG: alpha-galactosidase [Clostridia bacterium]|nr:alpha-galactosidase [Clostridia bacterium]
MNFDIYNFTTKLICEGDTADAKVETVVTDSGFELYITAQQDKPRFVELYWAVSGKPDTLVLGDAWERSYGDLEFRPLTDCVRHLPWYFIATDKEKCFCLGVKTGANSFVSFKCDCDGIKALVDCRNGGNGVHLGGRRVCLATFICEEYNNADVIACLKDFCRKMCDNPILPKERIFGGNNWYYAYGESSYGEIIADARLQAELAEGIGNKPFQVVDDCWQIHECEGPWVVNEKFGDMQKLAEEIKTIGARPGIWVRPLHNRDAVLTEDMRILRDGERQYLDPTHPFVQEYIKNDIERIRGWGYELVKHDFTTADLFGDWGRDLDATITMIDNWHFCDKTKTNAEIVLDLYRLIKDAAGDMLIIGCNTVSHLTAGLAHIYRTGDDTSGREWERTRKMGVNTLAFRLAQNEAFYMCDADCVGIIEGCIPWEKNKQWLHLLSYSNTPLFISCTDKITQEQREDIRAAYRAFHEDHEFRPLDIFTTRTPEKWLIDGETVEYNWWDD